MKAIELNVAKREGNGSRLARKLRRRGLVPANYFSKGEPAVSYEVSRRELANLLSKNSDSISTLFINLVAEGGENHTALISEVQVHPVRDEIMHVDFHGVNLNETVNVKVPIHHKGEPVGLRGGGVLEVAYHEIHIECRADQMPSSIDVDITELQMNEKIHISDLTLPEGVICTDDPETVVLQVAPPRAEEEEVEAVEEEEDQAKEPEVIKKGKEDSEESSNE